MPPIGDLRHDAVGGIRRLCRGLREVGVQLNLVDRRHDGRVLEEALQVRGLEVADPNRRHLPVGKERLERSVCRDGGVEYPGGGLVQDQQVDAVHPEFAGGDIERMESLVVAILADPHFRLDEHLVTVHARCAKALPDLTLVHVRGRGVDVPVPRAQRRLDRIRRIVLRTLENAEAEGRHSDAVVEGEDLVHASTLHSTPSTNEALPVPPCSIEPG